MSGIRTSNGAKGMAGVQLKKSELLNFLWGQGVSLLPVLLSFDKRSKAVIWNWIFFSLEHFMHMPDLMFVCTLYMAKLP